MLSTLLGIIVALVILGVVWWAVQQVIGVIPMGQPFATLVNVALVLFGVIVALYVLMMLLGTVGVHIPIMWH